MHVSLFLCVCVRVRGCVRVCMCVRAYVCMCGVGGGGGGCRIVGCGDGGWGGGVEGNGVPARQCISKSSYENVWVDNFDIYKRFVYDIFVW